MPRIHQMRSFAVAVAVTLLSPVAGAQVQQAQRLTYPEAKKIDQVDDFFGTKVSDPYRWMEDLNAAGVADWVKREIKKEAFISVFGLPSGDEVELEKDPLVEKAVESLPQARALYENVRRVLAQRIAQPFAQP